nr:ankyrin repeat-containing protein [Tanacetum cinerariifolium]
MIAFFTKLDASERVDQIIDFLNVSSIKYALTINPNIYVSVIKQFWSSVVVKKVNDMPRLQALVDRKKEIITEAIIRDALQLDDAEGIKCLPNEEIFTELARMGYEKPSTKLTFYKAFFSSQWKFLIHTILQCMGAKRTSWNEFSSSMALAIICLSTETPLFEGMIVVQQVAKGVAEVNVEDVSATGVAAEGAASVADNDVPTAVEESSIPSLTPPTQPPPPSQDILSTSQDKISQALEITKLKQRVKKLERRNKLKASKLRRLNNVATAQRIETFDDTVMDDVSKQGRVIADMDADVVVTLKDIAKDVKDDEIEESSYVHGRKAESQAQIYQIDLEHADKVIPLKKSILKPAIFLRCKIPTKGCWSEAKSILKNNIDAATEVISNNGNTMLHLAVVKGHNSFLKKLLNFIKKEDHIERRNSDGHTALHIAAIFDNKCAAELLVRKRKRLLYVSDNEDNIPLLSAYYNMKLSTYVYLLEVSEADSVHLPLSRYSDSCVQIGANFLINAIFTKQYDLVSTLINIYPELVRRDDQVLMAIAISFPPKLSFREAFIYPSWNNACGNIVERSYLLFDSYNFFIKELRTSYGNEKLQKHLLQLVDRFSYYISGPNRCTLSDISVDSTLHFSASFPFFVLYFLMWKFLAIVAIPVTVDRSLRLYVKMHTREYLYGGAGNGIYKGTRKFGEGRRAVDENHSESCSITAALIVTIVFALAITVPAATSLLFLSILTTCLSEKDFLVSLPKRLIRGLCVLFISATAMMVAFCATLYVVFCDQRPWMLAPIGGLALQFPLVVGLFISTYFPIFHRKKFDFVESEVLLRMDEE